MCHSPSSSAESGAAEDDAGHERELDRGDGVEARAGAAREIGAGDRVPVVQRDGLEERRLRRRARAATRRSTQPPILAKEEVTPSGSPTRTAESRLISASSRAACHGCRSPATAAGAVEQPLPPPAQQQGAPRGRDQQHGHGRLDAEDLRQRDLAGEERRPLDERRPEREDLGVAGAADDQPDEGHGAEQAAGAHPVEGADDAPARQHHADPEEQAADDVRGRRRVEERERVVRQQAEQPGGLEEQHRRDDQQQQRAQLVDPPEQEEIAEHPGQAVVGAVHHRAGGQAEQPASRRRGADTSASSSSTTYDGDGRADVKRSRLARCRDAAGAGASRLRAPRIARNDAAAMSVSMPTPKSRTPPAASIWM